MIPVTFRPSVSQNLRTKTLINNDKKEERGQNTPGSWLRPSTLKLR